MLSSAPRLRRALGAAAHASEHGGRTLSSQAALVISSLASLYLLERGGLFARGYVSGGEAADALLGEAADALLGDAPQMLRLLEIPLGLLLAFNLDAFGEWLSRSCTPVVKTPFSRGGGSLDNLSPRCQCQSVLAHTLRVWHHLLVSSVREWREIGARCSTSVQPSGRARQRVPFHTHSHSTAYEFYFDHLHFHFGCWPPYRDFGGGGARIQ